MSGRPAPGGADGVTVLVADDERYARRRLRRLLAGVEWIGRVETAEDGPSTIERIDALEPELVFLDIRMPGASGLEVLQAARHRPHVIFTTAYDRYAVTAFELHAVDYLLKPFGAERLRTALGRAREALGRLREDDGSGPAGGTGEGRAGDAGPADELERVAAALGPEGRLPLRRVFVRSRGRIVPVRLDEVERLEARGDYVALHTGDARHLVRIRFGDLLRRLDESRFVRVHRSHIVNLDRVEEFVPHPGERLKVRLRSGAEVVASRRRSRELRRAVL